MKKTMAKNRATNNKADEKFAKKIICQTVVALIVFALVFINSKLPYSINQDINNTVKHYLVNSIDFNKAFSTAKVYIDNLLSEVQTQPASGDLNVSSADES